MPPSLDDMLDGHHGGDCKEEEVDEPVQYLRGLVVEGLTNLPGLLPRLLKEGALKLRIQGRANEAGQDRGADESPADGPVPLGGAAQPDLHLI